MFGIRNPLGKTYGPSAAAEYRGKTPDAAAKRQVARENKSKVNAAKAQVSKCYNKHNGKKCGQVDSGIYCRAHKKQGETITLGY